jgi:hypothetical protein
MPSWPIGTEVPFDPDRRADEARPVWLPQLDRNVVLLAPAPKGFISIYCALFAEDADNGWFRIRSAAVS